MKVFLETEILIIECENDEDFDFFNPLQHNHYYPGGWSPIKNEQFIVRQSLIQDFLNILNKEQYQILVKNSDFQTKVLLANYTII